MKKKVLAAALTAVMLLSGCSGNPESPSGSSLPGESSLSENSSSENSSSENSSSESLSSESSSSENSSSESSSSPSPSTPVSEEEKYKDAPAPVIAANKKPSDYSTEPVPFKTEIDEFYKQVKELPIPDEYKGLYDRYTSDGYIFRKLDIDGIQLYEIRPEGDEPKPLVIQIHGGFEHKNPENIDYWADRGLCAVTIDVSCHGESQDGPLQAPAAWLETVKDIDVLIEYFNTIPGVDAKKFGLTGYSMGGNISELYTIYGKYKPTAICIENASADTTREGSSWDCISKGESSLTPIWQEEEMWKFTEAIAPINYPEYFKDIWMYICVGALDDIHSPEKMEEFKNKIEALGSDKIVFHRYEDLGHEWPPSWEENEREQFFEKLLS